MSTDHPHRIVLASGNKGKIAEFNALLADWRCEVIPQSHFEVPEVVEDGDSFAANIAGHPTCHPFVVLPRRVARPLFDNDADQSLFFYSHVFHDMLLQDQDGNLRGLEP